MSSAILCEPQCTGFEHASFNAALLEAVRLTEPEAKLVFMGERAHLSAVRCELVRSGRGREAEQVQWEEIRIPPRELGSWRRLKAEREWCKQVLKAASAPEVSRLILCSLTPTGLLWLKSRLLASRHPTPMLGVIHGILASIEQPQPRRPWHWATHLRQVLRLPHSKQLTYLLPGPSIQESVAEVLPGLASHFEALDPPYFMPALGPDTVKREGPVRFGFVGVGRYEEKGFDKFVRLAQEVAGTPSLPASEFVLVGFLVDAAKGGEVPAVKNVSTTPLSPDEYCARAQQLTYAIGVADPRHYRLVASASFLDALRYGKPGIYLRNRYLEHYFHRLGDVGYLCDSCTEVRELVFSIIKNFPESRYRQQCENIRRGRQLFEPRSVAGKLSDILGKTGVRGHRPSGVGWRCDFSSDRPDEAPAPTEGVKL